MTAVTTRPGAPAPGTHEPPARRTLALALALLAGIGIGHVPRLGAPTDVSVVVDAEVEKGNTIELFHNERWGAGASQAIVPGVRTAYRFDGLPRRLSSLRVDPTDLPEARIRIYGLRFLRRDRVVREIRPGAMQTWRLVGMTAAPAATPGVLEMVSTSPDPMVLVPEAFDFRRAGLLRRLLDACTPEVIVLALAGLFLAASGWRRRTDVQLPVAVVAVVVLLARIVPALEPWLGRVQSPDVAVGWANYAGYPKTAQINTFALSVLLAGIAGLACGRWLRPTAPPPEAAPRGRTPMLVVSLPLLLYAVAWLPPLEQVRAAIAAPPAGLQFDAMNGFVWRWAVLRGWLPLRDFWYPYGGFYWFWSTFPWSYLAPHAHDLLLLGILAAAVARLTNESPGWTLTIVACTLCAVVLGWFAHIYRYFLGLDLVLLYLAARARGFRPRDGIALALFAGYAFVLEPNQLVYAAVPIGAQAATDWATGCASRQRIVRWAFTSAALAGAVILGTCAVLWREGRLAGLIDFLGQMKALTVYASAPEDLAGSYVFRLRGPNLLVWGTLLMVAGGAALLAAGRSPWLRDLSAIAVGTGLLVATLMPKHIVRPDLSPQIGPPLAIGALLILSRLFPVLRSRQQAALLFALGVGVGAAADAGVCERLARGVRDGVARLPATARALATDRVALEAREQAAFEDARRYPEYRALIERLRTLTRETGGDTPLYDLGDEPVVYVALGLKPPYYITLYNTAPLAAQRRMTAWLATARPEWVVWRPSLRTFDDVPHVVRLPVLFAAVVHGYALAETVGDFDILRRRQPDQGLDVEYWRRRIGSEVDLAALPAFSRLADAPPCTGDERCVPVLHVRVAQPLAGHTTVVPLQVAGRDFRVAFREQEGRQDYFIHASRLWFWRSSRALTLPAAPDGVQVALERRRGAALLY